MMQRMISSLKTLFGINPIIFPEKKTETKEEEFDISEMYMTLSEAKEEIWRRWNDTELRKKVEDYLGEIPEPFRKEPRAVLARHITTPNLEFLRFLDLARLTNLKPINLEYLDDKYLSCNPAKLSLGKICFLKKGNKKNKNHTNEYIIDFLNCENKPLNELKTLWGESLVDFHHEMLKKKGLEIDIFDISRWYKKKGGIAKRYIKYYLVLFIQNGILFENYLMQKNEKQFTLNVILPAIKEIEKSFGIRPLIVPVLPLTSEMDEASGWLYSDDIKNFLNKN